MKTPDPDQSMNLDQPEQITGELIQNPDDRSEVDPLNVLLTETLPTESNDERLYTDEFIRANENASRSLFLGFLGISLLGTSLFALFILTQPKINERDNNELNNNVQEPVPLPSPPPVTQPNINVAPPSTPPPSNQVPATTPQGSEPPQSPLVFPVTPITPAPETPTPPPSTNTLPKDSAPLTPPPATP